MAARIVAALLLLLAACVGDVSHPRARAPLVVRVMTFNLRYHYNVHLDHRDLKSREAGVVRLMRHIAGRAGDDPFVVTGDFNTGEKSAPMEFLRGDRTLPDDHGVACENPIPLVDTYRVLHPAAPESGTAGGFRGRRTGGKIDHVLVAAGAATVRAAAIVHTQENGRYPSDHFPVTAVIEWR